MLLRRPVVVAVALTLVSVAALPLSAAAQAPPPLAPAPSPPAVPGELLIGYEPGTTPQQQTAARVRLGAVEIGEVTRGRRARREVDLVRVPGAVDPADPARAVAADPVIAFAEPNWIVSHQAEPAAGGVSNDQLYVDGSLYGMYGDATTPRNRFGSQAGEAWAAGTTGSANVYVGVIDEGMQIGHPDLDANVWINPFDPVDGLDNDGNGLADDTNGWDFTNNDRSVYDGGNTGARDQHGTHVAGTIGAEGGNAQGVAGVNWGVTMISGKFLGASGGTIANAVRAVDYFTDLKTRHGLNIIATNNSWGGVGFSQALLDAIGRANSAGILFIAAAGNAGADNDRTPSYPANYNSPNVIAVASITARGARSSFSNYGRTTVDLGAPGSDIWSTVPVNRYASFSGTSMATPHVTGAAALYASARPGATAAQIRAALLSSVIPTRSLASRTVTGGRLDATAALAR